MKRKILSFLLIFTLIISVSPLTGLDFSNIFSSTASAAESDFTWGDYNCTAINGSEVKLKEYLGDDINVIIPSEINGMPVTSIGAECFSGCWPSKYIENIIKIESITVPSTVVTICSDAFEYMDNLKTVTLSEGVQVIGDSAFANCPNLSSINIPYSIKNLGNCLFFECTSLKELTLPGKDITISYDAFSNSSIEKMNLNEGMTIIPAYFLQDTKVTSITLPSTITSIDKHAFYKSVETVIFSDVLTENFYPAIDDNYQFLLKTNSPALKNVYFRHMPSHMPYCEDYNISYDDNSGFWHCEYSGGYSSEVYTDRAFEYILNENGEAVLTKYIGNNPYIVVPDNVGYVNVNYGVVAEIGAEAFTDTLAQEVIIPGTIKRIGNYAFKNSNVSIISISEGIEEIGNGAFFGCTALEELALPESVTEIGVKAFLGCTNLKSINWPSKVNYVPADAFWDCRSFNDFGIFENVEIISSGAFIACGSLVVDNFGDKLKEIGDFAFTTSVLVGNIGPHATINTEKLPESLEYIGDRAFIYNESFKKIIIPESIKHIGKDAFAHSALEQVELPDNLKEIPKGAFAFTPLQSIDLPDNLEKIGKVAFYECLSLDGIEFPDTVTYIGESAFEACEAITSINIPPKLETINNSTFAYLLSIVKIHIPSTVKTICDDAFTCCDNVVEITIENGVESIGNEAFFGSRIKEITIPESVKKLGYGIIAETEAEVVYYNAVEFDINIERATSTNKHAKFSTDTLKKIVFGEKVTFVPAFFSLNCESLEEIVFSDSITEIDYGAFMGCTGLRYVKLPKNLKTIEPYLFYNCSSLKTICIPDGVTEIKFDAFNYCTSLITANIPDSVTEISDYAFECCNNLTIVCSENSYAYLYAMEHGIPVKVPNTAPAPDNSKDEDPLYSKQAANDYFSNFFESFIMRIREFFDQFTIFRR
ncbi:MAG: leucine-rich repeat domain-containing protein [Ruminococcaceae bacterium]|nr:leucine-rich repeat domain-containing protein [Oscillospiraceae bacterium]